MKAIRNCIIGLSCFVLGCTVTRQSTEQEHLAELKRVRTLREGMHRTQVNAILKPVKEGYAIGVSGIEHGFYWLSANSGVYLDYAVGGPKKSPTDILISSPGSIKLSIRDNETGKWSDLPSPQVK